MQTVNTKAIITPTTPVSSTASPAVGNALVYRFFLNSEHFGTACPIVLKSIRSLLIVNRTKDFPMLQRRRARRLGKSWSPNKWQNSCRLICSTTHCVTAVCRLPLWKPTSSRLRLSGPQIPNWWTVSSSESWKQNNTGRHCLSHMTILSTSLQCLLFLQLLA